LTSFVNSLSCSILLAIILSCSSITKPSLVSSTGFFYGQTILYRSLLQTSKS
jgi:hypothetical protein